VLDGSGHDSVIIDVLNVDSVQADHGIGLAGSGLATGQNRPVVPSQALVDRVLATHPVGHRAAWNFLVLGRSGTGDKCEAIGEGGRGIAWNGSSFLFDFFRMTVAPIWARDVGREGRERGVPLGCRGLRARRTACCLLAA